MNQIGKLLLSTIKNSAGKPGPQVGLTIPGFEGFFLRPVASVESALDMHDITCLTDWRNQHPSSFLSEFKATNERTARWLIEVVNSDDGRILFMLDDIHGQPVGYMGIAFIDWENSSGEADAIVAGRERPPGLMREALKTLLSWAHGQLGLHHIGVRVLSDNTALEFYKKLGFTEDLRVPLRREQQEESTNWIEDRNLQNPSRTLVHMTWNAPAV